MDFGKELDARVAVGQMDVTCTEGGVTYTRNASGLPWLPACWRSLESGRTVGDMRWIDGALHRVGQIDHGGAPLWPWTPRVDTVTWAKVDTKAECAAALAQFSAAQPAAKAGPTVGDVAGLQSQVSVLRRDTLDREQSAMGLISVLSDAITRESDARQQALSALRVDIDAAIAREVARVLGERKGAGKARKGKGAK